MVDSELPQEIWIDIFWRLPVKSVGQSRCVSKPWRDILSSPHFIKSHLNRKPRQESLLLIDQSHSIFSVATIEDGCVAREFDFPFDCSGVVGSCDGLVLLVNNEDDKFLVNPVTLKKVIIPDSPLALKDKEREMFSMHGFGYDSCTDDYMIVTLSCYNDECEVRLECDEMFVDVYSVRRGVWKRVESCPYGRHTVMAEEPRSGAFLNRAIHWLAKSRDDLWVLVAFDLFDEVFTEIPGPPVYIQLDCIFSCHLVVLGGCLCIMDVRCDTQTDVWMMKLYGLEESWTKHSSVIGFRGTLPICKPLCFVWDGAMVSVADGQRHLVVFNLKAGTFRKMIVDEDMLYFENGVSFVPSLVSPANVDKACMSDDALVEASAAKLDLALSNNRILVQKLKDYMTIVNAIECCSSLEDKTVELVSELQKRSDKLRGLAPKYRKLHYCIRWLSYRLGNQSIEAYKASTEFQPDLYEQMVRMFCRQPAQRLRPG